MALTIFDIITLTIISISTLFGLYKGAVGIVINLLGFIASIVLAYSLFPHVKLFIVNYINNELFLNILSFFIAYLMSLLFFTFLVSKVTMLFSFIAGGFFDRSLGLVIGFIRGGLVALIIYLIAAIFSSGIYLKAENLKEMLYNLDEEDYADWLKKSMTLKYYQKASVSMFDLIPEQTLESIKMPAAEDNEDQDSSQDIIDKIKQKKNPDGVSSTIEVPSDTELNKNIEELAD